MALVIVPLNSLAFPSILHRKKKMLRNGAMGKKSTGWHEKEEGPTMEIHDELTDATCYGRGAYGQKALQEGGDEDSKARDACL